MRERLASLNAKRPGITPGAHVTICLGCMPVPVYGTTGLLPNPSFCGTSLVQDNTVTPYSLAPKAALPVTAGGSFLAAPLSFHLMSD